MRDDEILHILSAEVVGDYLLRLEFDDHTAKTVNCRPLLDGPVAAAGPGIFRKGGRGSGLWHRGLAEWSGFRSRSSLRATERGVGEEGQLTLRSSGRCWRSAAQLIPVRRQVRS